MNESPAYYRARNDAIRHWLQSLPREGEIEVERDVLLFRNGFIPDYDKEEFERTIQELLKTRNYPDTLLSFTELTGFNTWFTMHPEKVAGVEYASTSVHFPIMLKGTSENVIETIRAGLKQETKEPMSKELEAAAEAEALLLELELLNI